MLDRASFYLDQNVQIQESGDDILIYHPNSLLIEGLRRCSLELAQWVSVMGKKRVILQNPGDDPYEIHDWFVDAIASTAKSNPTPEHLPSKAKINTQSDHVTLLRFLAECRESGFVVLVARMDNSDLVYVNDLMPENRVLVSPIEMLDKSRFDNNYLWRDSLEDKRLMEELLQGEGFISRYEHRIRRVDDSMCKFAHNFHLVNWLGHLCRLVVSRPGDFEVIEAPVQVEV
jgi:hypothetical protein